MSESRKRATIIDVATAANVSTWPAGWTDDGLTCWV